jgi:sugar O-acyltransferase (sialic acid O-acetyltransferase NeuD family)
MKRLAIIGCGDLGKLIAHHALTDRHYEVTGFFDDLKTPGDTVMGLPVLGNSGDIKAVYSEGRFDCLMVAIGYKHFNERKRMYDTYSGEIPFGRIIHSSCYVDPGCTIGDGVFILPGCVLDHNVKIGDNVLLNTGCCIAHDSEVKDHSFLSPRVCIAGFTKIGSCCNIGINATIIDNIEIPDHVQIGAGAVVVKNIAESGVYIGNPAKYLKPIQYDPI